jgi:aspartate/methionine/tyrosine aminotransferase
VIKLVCEGAMTVSRLRDIPGIGVDKVGDAADAAADPRFLRLENLDTDLRPPQVALEATHAAIDRDDANSYLPFQGHLALREAACAHVAAITGRGYDPGTQCVSVAGGLNGILNVLLATVEPGQEVVICDPVYAGLVNRIRLAGGVPVEVVADETTGYRVSVEQLEAARTEKTKVVLFVNMGATLVNATLDYLWIFGHAGFARRGFLTPISPSLARRAIKIRASLSECAAS